MKSQQNELTVQERAQAKVDFRIHLITYVVINSLLAAINLIFTPGYLWFIWPLMGWGIGIIAHAIKMSFSVKSSIKERMIEKELRRGA